MSSQPEEATRDAHRAPGIQVEIPLGAGFQFVHEPIHSRIEQRFVGRADDISDLVQRIRFSEGGSFLITGYRGVGKTSFVNQVLSRLGDQTTLVDVQINLARPLQPSELMHLIVRRLYDRLEEKRLYGRLRPELQTTLSLAYQRTSANVVRTLSEGWERALETGDLNVERHTLPFVPKFSAKRSRTVDLDTSFLAYDDKAAEHDVIAISRELSQGIPRRQTGIRVLMSRMFGRRSHDEPIKIVFVLDELDKLDEQKHTTADRSIVDDMLSSLKNLFTTVGSGQTWLLQSGPEDACPISHQSSEA